MNTTDRPAATPESSPSRPLVLDRLTPPQLKRTPNSENGAQMSGIRAGRHTASFDQPLALFLVGMRIHKPLRPRSWWPVFTAMSQMLRELQSAPNHGLLAATLAYTPHPVLVQYWMSPEHVERFAHDPGLSHRPAWKAFNQLTHHQSDLVGLWHELYVIDPATTRSLYRDTPLIGLAAATNSVPLDPTPDSNETPHLILATPSAPSSTHRAAT